MTATVICLMVVLLGHSIAIRPQVGGTAALTAAASRLETAAGSADRSAALRSISGVIEGILAEIGDNPHITSAQTETLEDVEEVVTSMYVPMKNAHNTDVKTLGDAIIEINRLTTNMEKELSADGDVGELEEKTKTDQGLLNTCIQTMDTAETDNNTAWTTYDNHMKNGIEAAKTCPSFPAQNPSTKALFDSYFDSSEYVNWYDQEKLDYEAVRGAWETTDQSLTNAINAYYLQLFKRDAQYCDWQEVSILHCETYDADYHGAVTKYNEQTVVEVQAREAARIEVYKACQTVIHQIDFLLGKVSTQEVPELYVSEYVIDYPSVTVEAPKGNCDQSPLEAATWNPTPVCQPDFKTRNPAQSQCPANTASIDGDLIGLSSWSVVFAVDWTAAHAEKGNPRQWLLHMGHRGAGSMVMIWWRDNVIQFGRWDGPKFERADVVGSKTIAFVFNSAEEQHYLFIDGALVGVLPVPGGYEINSADLNVGGISRDWDFTGCIKGVDVYRYALDTAQAVSAGEKLDFQVSR